MRGHFLRAALAGAVGGGGYDTDAQTWFTDVETEDGQALEVEIKDIVNDFAAGVKADGDWSKLKQCLIIRGPRTIDGAIVELVGNYGPTLTATAPQHERKRGSYLATSVNNIYINTNLPGNALSQNDHHVCWYLTTRSADDNNTSIFGNSVTTSGAWSSSSRASASQQNIRNLNNNTDAIANGPDTEKFACMNRNNSADYEYLTGTTRQTIARASATPTSNNFWLHRVNGGTANGALWGLAFWSAGDAFADPETYRARVQTLMDDLNTALP
jgi:hypothetical protein